MFPNFNIEKLTTQEKIAVMEQLWESLSQSESEVVPAWHLDILAERADRTDFISLEQAQKNLEANFKR